MYKVQGERFYHVNQRSAHGLMAVGQTLLIGKEENPFFQYYRKHICEYPVTLPDGTAVRVKALKFLNKVRQGEISTHDLPNKAYEVAQHFLLLARELLWETIRLSEFSDRPSRQRGLWLVSSTDELFRWARRLDCVDQNQFRLVEVTADGIAHRCDAGLLLGDSEVLDETEIKARKYWRGDMLSERSEPEILFEGRLTVTNIINTNGEVVS